MNERLKKLRKLLGLSQEEFGKKLGVGKTSISRLESKVNNFTDQMILSICREFNVDYAWFTQGGSEEVVFANIPETALDELAEDYDLDDLDKKIISEYLKLDNNQRNVLKNYIKNIFSE